MNEEQQCEHKFQKFSIAMIGIRWQCVKCDLIAPACFEPVDEAKAFFDEHIVIAVVK